MSVIKSNLNPRSAEFKANAAAMQTLVADLREKSAQVARGGSEDARAKHLARGKLLARDRVDGLLDPGAGFLELSQLAAWGMYEGGVPADARVLEGLGRHRIAVDQVDLHLRRAVLVDQRVDLDLLRLAERIDVVEQRVELVHRRDAVRLPANLGTAGAADRRLERVVGVDVRLDEVELEFRRDDRLPAPWSTPTGAGLTPCPR